MGTHSRQLLALWLGQGGGLGFLFKQSVRVHRPSGKFRKTCMHMCVTHATLFSYVKLFFVKRVCFGGLQQATHHVQSLRIAVDVCRLVP